jgi:hypothetical protein
MLLILCCVDSEVVASDITFGSKASNDKQLPLV